MNANTLEFQKIFEDFQPRILRYLARLVGDSDAEDLTQETFVKVHKGLENFKGESQLSTWIYRIATNTALDRMRSPSFQLAAQFSLSEIPDETEITDKVISVEEEKPPVEKQLIKEEMNDCIRGYIEKLPETYRAVLVMSEYEGLKNNEVAEILGITLDTVKIRLHRAKVKLKEELENNCDIHWIEEIPCSVMKPIK
jgi:RNA polymerase sigma-70 factor (ECF subfamily)